MGGLVSGIVPHCCAQGREAYGQLMFTRSVDSAEVVHKQSGVRKQSRCRLTREWIILRARSRVVSKNLPHSCIRSQIYPLTAVSSHRFIHSQLYPLTAASTHGCIHSQLV